MKRVTTTSRPTSANQHIAGQGPPDQRGMALILAMMAVFLLAAIGASLAVLTNTELRIVANHADGMELRYVAEAALESVIQDLETFIDWDGLLAGPIVSALADGVPGGQRPLLDGTSIDLDNLTGQLLAEIPACRLFAFAPAQRLQPADNIGVDGYIVVWIGDDAERDPAVLIVRSEAFGVAGLRKSLEARVLRTDTGALKVLAWEDR